MFSTRRLLLAVCLLPPAWAAPHNRTPVVFACLQSETFVAGGVLNSGEQTAAQIFSNIGVDLRWSCDATAPKLILIRLAARVPKRFRNGALAFALPFARNGVRITVFYDRLEPIFAEHMEYADSILGHVLAHEIAHVLERVDAHGESGLMRARWDARDFTSMKFNTFHFAPEDAQTIRESVEKDMPVE
ncbi:MAG TPA: hypothetical protein VKT81_12260 [Bryobacteraceae bacterium]|nr:hypothetical protein [Bryobacteraceae bacterium]